MPTKRYKLIDSSSQIEKEENRAVLATTSTSCQQQTLNIHPSDRQHGTYFIHAVFDNVYKVLSSPSDQNLRQKMPIGFPGFACLHCQGLSRKRNGGRYFPSSLKTLSDSKKVLFPVHQHLQNCEKCPEEIKKDLQTLMSVHEEERLNLPRGSQTCYYLAVWQAIHGSPPPDLAKKYKKKRDQETQSSQAPMMSQQYHHYHPRLLLATSMKRKQEERGISM